MREKHINSFDTLQELISNKKQIAIANINWYRSLVPCLERSHSCRACVANGCAFTPGFMIPSRSIPCPSNYQEMLPGHDGEIETSPVPLKGVDTYVSKRVDAMTNSGNINQSDETVVHELDDEETYSWVITSLVSDFQAIDETIDLNAFADQSDSVSENSEERGKRSQVNTGAESYTRPTPSTSLQSIAAPEDQNSLDNPYDVYMVDSEDILGTGFVFKGATFLTDPHTGSKLDPSVIASECDRRSVLEKTSLFGDRLDEIQDKIIVGGLLPLCFPKTFDEEYGSFMTTNDMVGSPMGEVHVKHCKQYSGGPSHGRSPMPAIEDMKYVYKMLHPHDFVRVTFIEEEKLYRIYVVILFVVLASVTVVGLVLISCLWCCWK